MQPGGALAAPCRPPAPLRCAWRRPHSRRCAAHGRRSRAVSAAAATPSAVTPELIALAHDLADAAGEISRKYFRTRIAVDVKSDASPVTAADRAAEAAMRALVASRAPSHSVFGEEAGLTRGRAPLAPGETPYCWVLDPIDGTKSFITGKPLFGTLIALVNANSGEPVLGLIDQPVLRERWLGVQGAVTTMNGAACGVRRCAQLSDAYMFSTTPLMFDAATKPAWDDLAAAVRMPLFGCDCYAYGLLSLGLCDLVAEADLKPYDYMALVPVVTGAGGVMTDWRGAPLRWRPSDAGDARGEVLAAGDAAAHAAALAVLERRFR